MQGTIRDREKTLRGLEGLESGQRYFDGWTINYNVIREHEGIKFQTPAEMAGVNPPFTEWADVVRVAATDTRRKSDAPDLAEVADRTERHGESTAPPTTHFVPDTTRRLRPKGETDTDDPDEEWPPTPATVERWRANGKGNPVTPNSGAGRMHTRGGGEDIRQLNPKSKALRKSGRATAGRVASATPKRAKQR